MAHEKPIDTPTAGQPNAAEHTRCGCYYRPSVDIQERPEELVVLADVPGAKGDEIDVDFEFDAGLSRAPFAPQARSRLSTARTTDTRSGR